MGGNTMPIIINPIFSTQQEITQKKLQLFTDYSKLIQWGRQNPDQFIEQFLGITYNDAQRYCVCNMWGRKHVVLVCCRSFGKSFLTGPYLMARSLLYGSHRVHIIAPTGGQAQETLIIRVRS